MAEKGDLKKVFNQHVQLEDFFTGFAVRPVRDKALGLTACEGPVSNGVKSDEPDVLYQSQDNDVIAELKQLAKEVDACRKCDLGNLRKNSVPGEGNPHAQIVFVGEGPGADEDAQGRPFVGRSGQLLDKIIVAMGLKRGDVYICNIIKCRPPENREPRPEEIISCLPYLKRQLSLIRPQIIVALGAPAAKTLLETNKPIGQLRGKFQDFYFDDFSPPIKLMPTFHPAYLLRNYSDENRRKVWEDMKTVLAELGLPIPKK
ncbi:MAG: uracil-DNA glycosylase [Phycisphaerae bacterium]|nr:uracil-DNA glycosylase [Phycisphaerae bacterium]